LELGKLLDEIQQSSFLKNDSILEVFRKEDFSIMEFLAKYGLEIVCTLVAAGALALCRAFNKKLKEYKGIVDA
jgi:hypothetical protein